MPQLDSNGGFMVDPINIRKIRTKTRDGLPDTMDLCFIT